MRQALMAILGFTVGQGIGGTSNPDLYRIFALYNM
jgi:hypothetical protein